MAGVVLVVITDPGAAQGFERAFDALGAETVLADEAESALLALEFEKPVAVIVENDLPDRSGTDLVRAIRELPEGEALPIVLLSGPMMTAEELSPGAIEAGATVCLDEAVDRPAVASALLSLLENDSGPMQALVDGRSPDEEAAPEGTIADDDLPFEERSSRSAAPGSHRGEERSGRSGGDGGERAGSKERREDEESRPRAAAAGTERSGSLDTLPFGRLLADLERERATGVLELARDKVKKSIWLREGVPIFAKSNAMGETLGAVLVKMNKIDEAQRKSSIASAQKSKRRHGDVLVELGHVTPKDVTIALQAQSRAKVINCFAWDEGTYSFSPSDARSDDLPEIRMTFGALIAAGVKQRYDLPRLRKVLLPFISETPRFQEAAAPLFDEMRFEVDEQTVIESLQGRRSLAEVMAMSEMEEKQLHRILVTSYFAGLVRFAPEGPVTKQLRITGEAKAVGRDGKPSPGSGQPFEENDEEVTRREDSETEDPENGGGDPGTGATTAPVPGTERSLEGTAPPAMDPAVEAKIEKTMRQMLEQNYYERMSLPTDATAPAIKSSYLRLAKDFHPDRLVSRGGAGLKGQADRLFALISEANQTLSDPAKRRKYDDEVLHGKSDDASEEANAILNAEDQFLKGERLLQGGSVEKAFEAFRTAVELYPKESEYQACYGWSMFKLHHPDDPAKANEGEKIVREALKSNKRNDKAHLFLGQIARIRGDADEARKQFEKALAVQPGNVEAQRELRVLEMREAKNRGIGGLFRSKK